MATLFDAELEDRLVRYVQIDSPSDESSPTSPSTKSQFDMQNLLAAELKEIGASDIALTDYGALLATIPATSSAATKTIAFLAHVDTAPGFNGLGVKPRVHHSYDGSDIRFPDDPEIVLTPSLSPYLASKVGDTIITASGTTLLGADDKAGVAIVMAMAKHLLANPAIQHGPIRICFTPDEEIGRGVHPNLPADLESDIAYTLDGAELGEVVYETFSADKATVKIQGVSIHPGQAKDVMVNALHLAAKIIDTLPHVTRTPETTDGRQGFIHAYQLTGGSAVAEIHFILRDFEEDILKEHGEILQKVCDAVLAGEPRAHITCEITPAVPKHALLARKRHEPGRAGQRGLPPGRHRTICHAHPRRYRRITADRTGRSKSESVHRNAGHSRPARVGQCSGHGQGDRSVRTHRRTLGEKLILWLGSTIVPHTASTANTNQFSTATFGDGGAE